VRARAVRPVSGRPDVLPYGPRRAISGPLASVKSGRSQTLMDNSHRRPGRMTAETAQVPKLIVRVRFPSPAPWSKTQVRAGLVRPYP